MDTMGKLHLYTGDGKGKTTSAMGLALRMLGHGKPVYITQFMKQGNSGELVSLRKLEGAHVDEGAPMRQFTFQMNDEQLEQTRREQTEHLQVLAQRIAQIKPALTVLDELAIAMQLRIVPQEAAMALIEEALQWGDVAVTGRNAPQSLRERADYVSDIRAEKHPFNEGIPAREGIEW